MSAFHVLNILRSYYAATPEQREAGIAWYRDANSLSAEIADGNTVIGAGVLTAFSPCNSWNNNVRVARIACESGTAIGHTPNLHTGVFTMQAERIIHGEHPLDVFKGDKQRAFFAAILDVDNSTVATIDRHAHDIAMGRVFTDADRKIGKRVFRTLSNAYVEAAELAGISVAAMQAATWVYWRENKTKPAAAEALTGPILVGTPETGMAVHI